MDGFKEINDTLGHPTGDAVLIEIGARLTEALSNRATVSRLGGDEFCIIYPGLGSVIHEAEISKELHELLASRYIIDGNELSLGASVGFARAPEHANNDQDLLAFADTAMFHAKETGAAHACYDEQMTKNLSRIRILKAKLAPALARDEFFLLYQPQVEIQSGKILGVEALIRWKHQGEIISPFTFIPLLEQTGGIIEVGRWIIHEACRQQSSWHQKGHDLKMSINLSAVQFRDPELSQTIASALEEFNTEGDSLDFEITEGVLINDVDETVSILNRIKQLGPTVSIDDFGTGYSSLAYLRQLPIDRLKIDRAFIKDVPDTDDGSLAGGIISLGRTLGVTVLAEGVETEVQLDVLRQFGCDEYQGYFLSRPVSPEEIIDVCKAEGCSNEISIPQLQT